VTADFWLLWSATLKDIAAFEGRSSGSSFDSYGNFRSSGPTPETRRRERGGDERPRVVRGGLVRVLARELPGERAGCVDPAAAALPAFAVLVGFAGSGRHAPLRAMAVPSSLVGIARLTGCDRANLLILKWRREWDSNPR
jgi:hypothetical protein